MSESEYESDIEYKGEIKYDEEYESDIEEFNSCSSKLHSEHIIEYLNNHPIKTLELIRDAGGLKQTPIEIDFHTVLDEYVSMYDKNYILNILNYEGMDPIKCLYELGQKFGDDYIIECCQNPLRAYRIILYELLLENIIEYEQEIIKNCLEQIIKKIFGKKLHPNFQKIILEYLY